MKAHPFRTGHHAFNQLTPYHFELMTCPVMSAEFELCMHGFQYFGMTVPEYQGAVTALARLILGMASIARRDLISQCIFFSRRILTDICKRKNVLWKQGSSEMPSIP
jgi:hypothetical protein